MYRKNSAFHHGGEHILIKYCFYVEVMEIYLEEQKLLFMAQMLKFPPMSRVGFRVHVRSE